MRALPRGWGCSRMQPREGLSTGEPAVDGSGTQLEQEGSVAKWGGF